MSHYRLLHGMQEDLEDLYGLPVVGLSDDDVPCLDDERADIERLTRELYEGLLDGEEPPQLEVELLAVILLRYFVSVVFHDGWLLQQKNMPFSDINTHPCHARGIREFVREILNADLLSLCARKELLVEPTFSNTVVPNGNLSITRQLDRIEAKLNGE